jgi:periplasmic protein TonB
MEQKRTIVTLSKRSLIILCSGLFIIAGVISVALKRQPDYSFFEQGTESIIDTTQQRPFPDEMSFPDAPVLPAPKKKQQRQPQKQEEPILPEILLDDPVEITHTEVIHPRTDEEIFATVDKDAKPLNGHSAFKDFIQERLKYPVQASRMKVEGIVRVEFVVEKNGVISEVKSTEGIGAGCDEEAVRLISASPPWSPALIDEHPVRQRRSIAVVFKLDRRTRRK